MEPAKVSKTLLRRLPIYLEHLRSLPEGDSNVSATAIARELGLGHVLVRKDLAKISIIEGRCRTGRSRKQLIQDIEDYLDCCSDWTQSPDFGGRRICYRVDTIKSEKPL